MLASSACMDDVYNTNVHAAGPAGHHPSATTRRTYPEVDLVEAAEQQALCRLRGEAVPVSADEDAALGVHQHVRHDGRRLAARRGCWLLATATRGLCDGDAACCGCKDDARAIVSYKGTVVRTEEQRKMIGAAIEEHAAAWRRRGGVPRRPAWSEPRSGRRLGRVQQREPFRVVWILFTGPDDWTSCR